MADVTTTFAAKDESFAKTVTNLQGRLTGFSGSVEGFNSKVAGMASSFARFATPIAAVGLAFLGAKSAAQAFTEAISMGGQLNDLASRTGETAGNLAILQRAFDNAGSSADSVGPVLNKLQRAIIDAGEEGGKFADLFRALGISLEDFKGKTPTEQLQMVAKALSEVEDPAKRSQLAMELLGKSGGELLPVLRAMGVELETARNQLGRYPEAIDLAAKSLDDIGDNFNAISKKGMEFATGLMVDLAPALAEITAKIAEIDAAGFGMMISEYVMKMVQGVDGAFRFSEAIDNIKLAIEGMAKGELGKGLELMWVTMKITALNAINEIVNNFIAGLQSVGQFLAQTLGPDSAVFSLLTATFDLLGKNFESSMSSAIAKIVQFIPYFGEEAALALNTAANAANVEANKLKDSLGGMAKEVGKELFEAGKAMPQSFAENKSALDPLFNLTDELAQQKLLQEQITAKIQEAAVPSEQMAQSAKSFSSALAESLTSLTAAMDLSGNIFTNLNNSSIASQNVGKAFELGSNSSGQIATDINSALADAGRAANFLGEGSDATNALDLNGRSFAESAANAAGNLERAKIDANITSDTYTGMSDRMAKGANAVDQSIEKMREAHHFGQRTVEQMRQDLEKAGQSLFERTQNAGKEFTAQTQLSTEMRRIENVAQTAHNKYERGLDRAAKAAERGQDTTANNIRRRAEERFTKDMEELGPHAKEGALEAEKMLGAAGLATGSDIQAGGKGAQGALEAGAEAIAEATRGGDGGGPTNPIQTVLDNIKIFLDKTFDDFKKRVPQNALT